MLRHNIQSSRHSIAGIRRGIFPFIKGSRPRIFFSTHIATARAGHWSEIPGLSYSFSADIINEHLVCQRPPDHSVDHASEKSLSEQKFRICALKRHNARTFSPRRVCNRLLANKLPPAVSLRRLAGRVLSVSEKKREPHNQNAATLRMSNVIVAPDRPPGRAADSTRMV